MRKSTTIQWGWEEANIVGGLPNIRPLNDFSKIATSATSSDRLPSPLLLTRIRVSHHFRPPTGPVRPHRAAPTRPATFSDSRPLRTNQQWLSAVGEALPTVSPLLRICPVLKRIRVRHLTRPPMARFRSKSTSCPPFRPPRMLSLNAVHGTLAMASGVPAGEKTTRGQAACGQSELVWRVQPPLSATSTASNSTITHGEFGHDQEHEEDPAARPGDNDPPRGGGHWRVRGGSATDP